MKTIRNFVYLDEYKMYSLSSQIFEGITEYLIETKCDTSEDQESQKGPVGSGRIMADIIRRGSETHEKRFLHDYSYHLFEEHLHEQKKVLSVDNESVDSFGDNLPKFSFVRIRSKATFNDMNSIKSTIENFNRVGEAITYATNFAAIEEIKKQFQAVHFTEKDKKKKAEHQEKYKSLTNISNLAKEKGLHQDQTFLENLSFLLSYGFQDQLEIQLKVGGTIFSANLKRESLREQEALLIRKYSRMTEKEFVIFGMVTQSSNPAERELTIEAKEYSNIKEALMSLVMMLTNVEGTFTGRLSNEVIVDPIAIYTEL